MNTAITFKRKTSRRILSFAILFLLTLSSTLSFSQSIETVEVQEQGISIEGIVTNEDGPLPGATVALKGTDQGTSTDIEGKFKFPSLLNIGDKLIFSYLGYEPQEVTISQNTNFIRMELSLDAITIIEALNTETPYKSKRN